MTKRERKARLREIKEELVARVKDHFPHTEFVGTEDWPNDRFVIEMYTPSDDEFEIIRSVADRVVDLSLNEGLHVSVFPTREKRSRRAA